MKIFNAIGRMLVWSAGMTLLLVWMVGSNFLANELWFNAKNSGFEIQNIIATRAQAAELAQTRILTATKVPKKLMTAKPTELSGEQLISGFKNPQGQFTVTVPVGYEAFVSMDKGNFAGYITENSCGAVWLVGSGVYTGSTVYGHQYGHINAWAYANVNASVTISEAMKEAGPSNKSCDLFDLR